MHLKRQKIPKSWPIKRKGTKYIVRPRFGMTKGIPLLVVLREILKVAQNRKEVKRAIHQKHILVNGRLAKNEGNSLFLFDTLSIIPMKKHYRIELSNKGKFELKEINEKDSFRKISKISNKKILKGKKTQINLNDGKNFLSDLKCNVSDSVLINFKDKKIESCIPLKEKVNVFVIAGKHAGKKGLINKIKQEGKMAEIKLKEEMLNVLTKQLMAIQ